jgi:hypothetical protein
MAHLIETGVLPSGTARSEGRSKPGGQAADRIDAPFTVYFELTALIADPPRLLRTVMFCGFVGHEN